ncbi:MAG: serine/threonine-protein kinase [Planctomycetota bacterium]|jgi:serine/threonine-protein kinase|nr:serine/threonine-protein kinase [Planctomycetota bacterium]
MQIPRRLGKYEIEELIGHGSMGAVFRAKQDVLGRTVALKVLPPEKAQEDDAKVKRFKTEARSAAKLFHPHIATIYDIDSQDALIYFVMQYVEGAPLDEVIEGGASTLEGKLRIFTQLASAMALAHRHGIVHRDIKPSNIMIDPEGDAHMLDFGIAKMDEGRDITRVGVIVGSAPFMSPEQARGEKVDLRSDIFSLGAVMYNLFAGVKPFRASSKKEMILQRMNLKKLPREEQPRAILELAPDVPSPIVKIIDKCMRPDRVNRYQNDEELMDDLDRCRVFLSSRLEDQSLSRFEFMVREQLNIRELAGPLVLAALILLAGILVLFSSMDSGAPEVLPFEEFERSGEAYDDLRGFLVRVKSASILSEG